VAAELTLAMHLRRKGGDEESLRDMESLSGIDAGVIGAAQAVSILPGISRSGATIGAGLAIGMHRDAAARFAFLLSIPALLGASLVSLPDIRGTGLSAGAAIGGFLASLVTSYVAIAALIRYLRGRSLYPFAAYCVLAGIVFYVLV
ncbi:MAG TPA: undecaprenyl-diphosphate phosphatase, partial [Actinomycetota bacterium]|nr:undecaprenyl-diphosphate phosphatase [Actinomycetota bacterium]